MLVAIWRPRITGIERRDWLLVVAFGVSLAGMNFAFYSALDRIPLGVAVTLEFVGPLGVAVAGSRRALDLLWVVMAAAGILLLADPFTGGGTDAVGAGLALLAGRLLGRLHPAERPRGPGVPGRLGPHAGDGGRERGAAALRHRARAARSCSIPHVLLVGAGVAMLSSAIPYSLELEALRRLPAHVFGVLMSLEPGMAALAGFVVLGRGAGAARGGGDRPGGGGQRGSRARPGGRGPPVVD